MANRVYRVNIQKIKELIERKGMSIRQLEIASGVGNGAIAKWKTTDAKLDTLCRVAKTLNVKVDSIIEVKGIEESLR